MLNLAKASFKSEMLDHFIVERIALPNCQHLYALPAEYLEGVLLDIAPDDIHIYSVDESCILKVLNI
jgi:hypothetical protein